MQKGWSIRSHLFALILVVLLPLALVLVYETYRDAEADAQSARDATSAVADVTAASVQQLIAEAQAVVGRMAERPMIKAVDPGQRDPIFDQFETLYPNYLNLVEMDLEGVVQHSALSLRTRTNSLATRFRWFKKVLQTDGPVVGEPYFGATTGKWLSILAYPIHGEDGQIRGILAMAIDLARYREPFKKANLLPGSSIVIVDSEGHVVAHSHENDKWVGKTARGTEIVDIVTEQKRGQSIAKGLDGVEKIYSYTVIPGVGWRVYVSVPTDVAFAEVRIHAWNHIILGLVIFLLVLLLVGYLSRLISKPVHLLAHAATDAAQGKLHDPVPVRGPREIAALAREFNEMITLRQRADDALRGSEERYRRIVETAGEGIWVVDTQWKTTFVNPRMELILGYAPGEMQGRHIFDFMEEEDRRNAQEKMRYRESGGSETHEFKFRRKDGTRVWTLLSTNPVHDTLGRFIGALAMATDISERKLAEEQLREAGERLEALSRRLLEVQESERRHLARELHDEIGQALTATKINLQAMQRFPDPENSERRLADGIAMVERLIQQVRQLSLDMRPPLLDDLGLPAALRWLADQQSQLTGLPVRYFANTPVPRLGEALETACFRTAQEAMTNVVRHAQARSLVIELKHNETCLDLYVRDDGRGFDVAAARKRAERGASLGLLGMEERVVLAGGTMEIVSTPNQGTTIHACFPLPQSSDVQAVAE
jgi:PAS domain S-box-containing protein